MEKKRKTKQVSKLMLIILVLSASVTNVVYATTILEDSTNEKKEIQTTNEIERTGNSQSEVIKEEKNNLEAKQSSDRDKYFPRDPSQEDLLGDQIQPGEIPLPKKNDYGRRSYSALNQEILAMLRNGTIRTPKISNQLNNFIDRFGYVDGIGKPRGIVIHETANPNSIIQNEIKYMFNNWNNAFVHAYVDQNNIIEVHPSDYASWGAGRIGNKYFMHVELVEHPGNKLAFLKSVSNDAFYVATKLKQYGLLPSRATGTSEKDFSGTVWSHHEVSSILGGTNHTDPTGYFASFGYDMNQFFQMVQYHYENLGYDSFVYDDHYQRSAKIYKDNGRGIYDSPYQSKDARKIGDERNYIQKEVSITAKAVNIEKNLTYYQFALNGKVVGWLSSEAFQVLDKIIDRKVVNFLAEVKSVDSSKVHGLYNKIYNTEWDVQQIGNGGQYANKSVRIIEEAKTIRENSTTRWFKFAINNKEIGWMDSLAFITYHQIDYRKAVNFDKKFANNLNVHVIYDDIYNTRPGVKPIGKAIDYNNQVVHIVAEAKTQHAIWYLFKDSTGREVGWIDSRAFSDPDRIEYQKDVSISNLTIDPTQFNQPIYSGIYNTSANIKKVGTIREYQHAKLSISQEAKTQTGIWYKIKANNQEIGWVNSKALLITNQLTFTTHVENIGWTPEVTDGAVSGTVGKAKKLESIKIAIKNSSNDLGIQYATHVENSGWQQWVKDGALSGTTGKNKRLEAIRIKLTGKQASQYSVYYRVHAENFGWLDWAKDGQDAGTEGYGYRLEAIQICLIPKGNSAPGKMIRPYVKKNRNVAYQTHVESIGWQPLVYNGEVSGTVGRGKRLEGIKLSVANAPIHGGIDYKTHVENIGWQDWVRNNQLSGTTGRGLRLEAIQIKLTGDLAKQYDVYYRTHVQNLGWLSWAKNGKKSGSAGFAYRLEGIQVKLLKKNEPFKEDQSMSFIQK